MFVSCMLTFKSFIMKSKLVLALYISFCLLLFSCGNNTNQTSGGETNPFEDVLESKLNNSEVIGDNSCLYAYREKYDQLLSKEEVLRVTGFAQEKLTVEYQKTLANPKYQSYAFQFENGRMGKVMGLNMEVEFPDIIRVGGMEEMSLNTFKNRFRVPTAEEVKAARKGVEDVVDGKVKDPDAEAALQIAAEKNVSKETMKKTGNDLTDTFADIAKANTPVPNLGDAAVWNPKTNDLFVLQRGVKFELKADLGPNAERNKEVAVALARIILDKCK